MEAFLTLALIALAGILVWREEHHRRARMELGLQLIDLRRSLDLYKAAAGERTER